MELLKKATIQISSYLEQIQIRIIINLCVSEYLHIYYVSIHLRNMRRDVFQAIADPTRREIIDLIAHRPLTLNTIAKNFHMSRSAISQHIKLLSECGLVLIKQDGRERFCEVEFKKLNEVSIWIEQYRTFWTNKLDALEVHIKDKLNNNP